MEIHRVVQPLVMTRRLEGMGQLRCQVLMSVGGKPSVAMDPIGVKPGDWVFTIANSAARLAAGDPKYLTDLTVGGIIDNWETSWEEKIGPFES
ncbi:MAG: carboxysome peptide B [Halothiobacillaceae bacterium]